MQGRLDKKVQDLKLELEVLKKQQKQELMKLKIDIEERDNRIEIMLNLMKKNESKQNSLKNIPIQEAESEIEFNGDVEAVKQQLREARNKIKRLNKELDEKVARINQLEDNVMGHVEDKRCKNIPFISKFIFFYKIYKFLINS